MGRDSRRRGDFAGRCEAGGFKKEVNVVVVVVEEVVEPGQR